MVFFSQRKKNRAPQKMRKVGKCVCVAFGFRAEEWVPGDFSHLFSLGGIRVKKRYKNVLNFISDRKRDERGAKGTIYRPISHPI